MKSAATVGGSPSRLHSWHVAVLVGSVALAALELALTATSLPHYQPPMGGLFLSLLQSASTAALTGLLLVPLLWGLELAVRKTRLSLRPGPVLAGCAAVAIALVLIRLGDAFLQAPAEEFPAAVAAMTLVFHAGALLIAGMLAFVLVLFPINRFVALHPRFLNQRFLTAALAGVVLGGALLVLHGAIAPVYLTGPSAALQVLCIVSISALARLLMAERRLFAWRWTLLAFLLLLVGGRYLHTPHSRYMVFTHWGGTAPLEATYRNLLDFDGDGSLSTALGGSDCAGFDAQRGPLVREIPRDGIDQDCQGGDAKAPWPEEQKTSPWAQCGIPLSDKPSVLLLTVDALRADRLGPTVTPHLYRLRMKSTSFSRAYVASPLTFTSLGSLFSGRALSDMGMQNPVAEDTLHVEPHWVKSFIKAGYRSSAFEFFGVDHRIAGPFSVMNPTPLDVVPSGIKTQLGSAQMAWGILEFMRGVPAPTFVWAHFPDAHAPYLAPEEMSELFSSPYDAALNYVDKKMGWLFQQLAASKRLDSTIVIVTADHGEELRQHGREGHGPQLYEESIHVPLIVRVPGCPSSLIEHPVSLSKLIASLHDIKAGRGPARGIGQNESKRPVIVEEAPTVGLGFKRAIINSRYKLIVDQQNGGRVLFDLKEDFEESTDIYEKSPGVALQMEQAYQSWLDSPGSR